MGGGWVPGANPIQVEMQAEDRAAEYAARAEAGGRRQAAEAARAASTGESPAPARTGRGGLIARLRRWFGRG